jgi:hypothetical protein
MRGRVSAVSMMFIDTASHLGEWESGIAAAWFGATAAVVIGGVGTIAVVAIYTLFVTSLRKIDRTRRSGLQLKSISTTSSKVEIDTKAAALRSANVRLRRRRKAALQFDEARVERLVFGEHVGDAAVRFAKSVA